MTRTRQGRTRCSYRSVLAHQHNGLDLQVKYATETIENVQRIWGRPVHLQARIDDENALFSCDGENSQQQTLNDELPQLAHTV